MDSLIFTFVRADIDSVMPSMKIAKYVSNLLDIPICWDITVDRVLNTLIIVNGAYAWVPAHRLEALGNAITVAENVVWIQNDYTIIPPKESTKGESPFRRAFRVRKERNMRPVNYWTTIQSMSIPGISPSGHLIGDESRYINWNALNFDSSKLIENYPTDGTHGDSLIYYGSFRQDREEYFDRYFTEPKVGTTISDVSNKYHKFHRYMHPSIRHENRMIDLIPQLRQYRLGLYLSDRKSNKEFHSPANRFYEMLSARLPMVFQPEAKYMMGKAGYYIEPEFIVESADNIPYKMNEHWKILDQQLNRWTSIAENERDEVGKTVISAYERL